jgi:hypothetical protein
MDPHLAICLPRREHSADRRLSGVRRRTLLVHHHPGRPKDIRAYYNACLHRGTKLRASGSEGCASEFQCSFHGWSWNIDGTNKNVVCEWDFPHVDRKKLSLPARPR